jgi:outer membrane biosynthesis protein TonB
MDPGVRAARDQQARERLLAAAEALAAQHGLDDQLLALQTARTGPTGRHPLLGPLFQQEAAADFLEGLLAALAPGAPGAAAKPPKGPPAPEPEAVEPEPEPEAAEPEAAEPEAKPVPAKAVPRRGYPAVPAAPEKASEKAPEKAPERAPEKAPEKPAPDGGERR